MASLRDEIEALKRRLADAKAERARLRRALIPGEIVHPRSALKLPPSQCFVLACLLHRGPWTRESLAEVLRLHRHEAGEDDDEILATPRLIDVAVCKIRAATRGYGLEIKTLYGRGFNIVPSQRRAFRELLEAEAAQLDAADQQARAFRARHAADQPNEAAS